MFSSKNHIVTVQDASLVIEPKKRSPVVLSVPHDGMSGKDLAGLFEERKAGFKGRDIHVWPVTKDIMLAAETSAIRGLMPRAFVDYNRSWPQAINYYPLSQKEAHTALDDESLAGAYYSYHNTIDRLIRRSIDTFGKENTLLLDLHGFKKQPPAAQFDLILGTGNRTSIPHGDVDRRFAEFMRSRSYRVFLPEAIPVGPEEDYYSAEFTTRHHTEKHGINVIQIEIAAWFRTRENAPLGIKLAADIAEFLRTEYPH